MITELADNEEKYNEFYNSFHKQIKLGIHEDSDNRIKLSKLLRFYSLNSQEIKISLDSYLENMKEGENKIFCISGESVKSVIDSPFLEKLKIEGHDEYVKNRNGVVLNINKEELEAARMRKLARKNQNNEIKQLQNDVSEIKSVLTNIVEKLDGISNSKFK